MKKTLILGASSNPTRYSNMAARKLLQYGHPIVCIGKKSESTPEFEIKSEKNPVADLDTITLYLNANNQKEYYDYILKLQPKRIIFNPGAENSELVDLANISGIETVEACTLVMLSVGNF